MGYNSVPEGWTIYTNCGNVVNGTKFVPFKVPLRKEICRNLDSKDQKFTLDDLFELHSNFSVIIDLTKTKRYYNSEDIKSRNIKYIKLEAEGHGQLPTNRDYGKFHRKISEHLKTDKSNGLIGIHCTHGLNRTGYFICRYMIDTMSISGEEAINRFEDARGHKICRDNYRDYLMSYKPIPIEEPIIDVDSTDNNGDSDFKNRNAYGSYQRYNYDRQNNRSPVHDNSSYGSYGEARDNYHLSSYQRYDSRRPPVNSNSSYRSYREGRDNYHSGSYQSYDARGRPSYRNNWSYGDQRNPNHYDSRVMDSHGNRNRPPYNSYTYDGWHNY